jgi:Glycosyl transferase family 90
MASAKADNRRSVIFADPPSSSNFVSSEVSIEKLNNEVMDVAFVKAIDYHNYPGGLDAYMRDHRFADGIYLGDHWRHKYLVDLDGMSYSGRFFAFLESDSAVIKSTVYQEFHSDWIQPWYVYCDNFYQHLRFNVLL